MNSGGRVPRTRLLKLLPSRALPSFPRRPTRIRAAANDPSVRGVEAGQRLFSLFLDRHRSLGLSADSPPFLWAALAALLRALADGNIEALVVLHGAPDRTREAEGRLREAGAPRAELAGRRRPGTAPWSSLRLPEQRPALDRALLTLAPGALVLVALDPSAPGARAAQVEGQRLLNALARSPKRAAGGAGGPRLLVAALGGEAERASPRPLEAGLWERQGSGAGAGPASSRSTSPPPLPPPILQPPQSPRAPGPAGPSYRPAYAPAPPAPLHQPFGGGHIPFAPPLYPYQHPQSQPPRHETSPQSNFRPRPAPAPPPRRPPPPEPLWPLEDEVWADRPEPPALDAFDETFEPPAMVESADTVRPGPAAHDAGGRLPAFLAAPGLHTGGVGDLTESDKVALEPALLQWGGTELPRVAVLWLARHQGERAWYSVPGGVAERIQEGGAEGAGAGAGAVLRSALGPDPLLTHVPGCALTFDEEADVALGPWRLFRVVAVGEVGWGQADTSWPNALAQGPRAAFNVRHVGDLVRFLADAERAAVEAHIENLRRIQAERSYGRRWIFVKLRHRWGDKVLAKPDMLAKLRSSPSGKDDAEDLGDEIRIEQPDPTIDRIVE